MTQIRLESLSHTYRADPREEDYVLRNLNLTVEEGEVVALLGPSGCGKSTLLNIISGLVRPTTGGVYFGQKEVSALQPRERNIAQVFQFPVVYDEMTIYQNLAFPLRNRKLPANEIKKRVQKTAEILHLEQNLKQKARGLGAEMKQIVSLARGLVREDAAAILFDEPLTVIDPEMKLSLRRKLKEVQQNFKITMLYVTHDQTEALTFANQVVIMNEGRILQKASPEDLYRAPGHTFVGHFIGSPGMNFFPVTISGSEAILSNSIKIQLPEDQRNANSSKSNVKLGIRPTFFRYAGEREEGALPVQILEVQDLGRSRLITGRLGEFPVKIELEEPKLPTVGATTYFRLLPDGIRIFADDWAIGANGGKQ